MSFLTVQPSNNISLCQFLVQFQSYTVAKNSVICIFLIPSRLLPGYNMWQSPGPLMEVRLGLPVLMTPTHERFVKSGPICLTKNYHSLFWSFCILLPVFVSFRVIKSLCSWTLLGLCNVLLPLTNYRFSLERLDPNLQNLQKDSLFLRCWARGGINSQKDII